MGPLFSAPNRTHCWATPPSLQMPPVASSGQGAAADAVSMLRSCCAQSIVQAMTRLEGVDYNWFIALLECSHVLVWPAVYNSTLKGLHPPGHSMLRRNYFSFPRHRILRKASQCSSWLSVTSAIVQYSTSPLSTGSDQSI